MLEENVEKVLRRIEAENEIKNHWIVGPEVGRLLWWLVRAWAPKTILEIGTSLGYSAIWMGSALEANGGGKLWTVESHAQRFEKAQGNIAEAGLSERIVQVKGHAPEVFEQSVGEGHVVFVSGSASFAGPAGASFVTNVSNLKEIDFAFFDATKHEHASYFDVIFPRMTKGALLLIDNVQSHKGEMETFMKELAENPHLEEVEISIGSGLLLARKI